MGSAAGLILFVVVSAVLSAEPASTSNQQEVSATPYFDIVTGNLNVNQRPIFEQLGAILAYTSPHFDANANAMVLNDGLYSQQEPIPGGYRIQLNNGDVALKLKPFEIKGGLYTHADEVKSPYSLFFNPNGFSTTGLNLEFAQGIFFYKSEWLELNHLSANGYPDRGMNYKVYGVKIGRLRVGFQDVVLYLDRSFSADFFLNPIPMYLTQLVSVQGAGNPWLQQSNDNTLMGFFGDYSTPRWYSYAQVLIDDLSLTVFTPWIHQYVHPWKLAWSLGGTYDFPFGTVGFYQAGATKYTFEPTYQTGVTNTYPYQYTFYPSDQQPSPPSGTGLPIPYDNNYIGYQYGENNLAFMATYKKSIQNYLVGGDMEYTISGSKSPNNPWGNLTTYPATYFAMFDHSPLEQRLLLAGYAQRPFGGLTVSVGVTLGYVWHELQLAAATDGGPAIFEPSNTNRFLYQFDFGVSYKLSMNTSKPKK